MSSLKKFLCYFLIFATALGDVPFASATTVAVSNQKGQNLLVRSEQIDHAAWATHAGDTVTPNVALAPDGTMTADQIDFIASSYRYQGSNSVVAGRTYVCSIWVWSPSKATISLRLTDGDATGGAFTTVSLSSVLTRVSVAFTMTTTGSSSACGFDNRSGIGVGGDGIAGTLYAWGAQMVLGTKPGAYNRTVAAAFGSSYVPRGATQGSQLGQNLLPYSEQLNNASGWTSNGAGAAFATTTANRALAPDGTMTAEQIDYPASTGFVFSGSTSMPIHTTGTKYTLSVWLWSSSTTKAQIGMRAYTLPGVLHSSVRTLTLTTTPARYSLTLSITNANDTGIVLDLENRTAQGGDGIAGTLYAWGAQIVIGDKPGAYNQTVATGFKTSFVPRGANVSSQLGQNLVTKSEQINGWNAGGGAVVTADAALAPDGRRTADQIDYTTVTDGYVYTAGNVMPVHTTGTKYTLSVWLWSSSTTKAQIGIRGYTLPSVLNGGSKGFVLTTTPTRYTFTFALTNAADTSIVFDLENRVPYGADGLNGVMYVWGAQIVPGSKPGAYNRTTTASFNPNYVP